MSDFQLWLSTGFEHILDLKGYDHIAFVVALTAMCVWSDWKHLLIQITAFTIGHSLTLALSVMNVIQIQQSLIELLIPITILLTALNNIWSIKNTRANQQLNFVMAAGFGLIHGLGFSYLLKAMLGKEESIIKPLFAFNLGIELGQLLIVASILTLGLFLTRFLKISVKNWQLFASFAVLMVSIYLLVQRI